MSAPTPSVGRQEYGPFGFLNPTIQRSPFDSHRAGKHSDGNADTDGDGDAETLQNSGPGSSKRGKDELSAEDVQREFRSRDNRKG